MSDKERLDSIKTKMGRLVGVADNEGTGEADLFAISNDMNWLIQQAERVQELTKEIDRIYAGIEKAIEQTTCDDTWDYLNRLLEGNENSELPYRIGGRNDQP